VQAAREAARRAQCVNNMKQLGLATHNYVDRNRVLPAGLLFIASGTDVIPNVSIVPWSVAILPYMEQTTISNPYEEGLPASGDPTFFLWPATATGCSLNASYGGTVIPSYVCPSAPDASARVVTADGLGTDLALIGNSTGTDDAELIGDLLNSLSGGAHLWFPMAPMDYNAYGLVNGPGMDGQINYSDFAYAPPHDIYSPGMDQIPCPLTQRKVLDNPTAAAAMGGGQSTSTGMQEITDGTANTILLF